MRSARYPAAVAIVGTCLAALGAWPSAEGASAARVLDDKGGNAVALRGVVIWGRYNNRTGRTVLVRRVGGHVSPIPGVRPLINYNSLDLGLDRRDRVVAVFHRCDFRGACTGPYVVDVRSGGERRLRLPVQVGCKTSKGSASMWRDQVAFTRSCRDPRGNGAFLTTRDGSVRRLFPLSPLAAKFTYLNLVPGFVAVGVTLVSTGRQTCRTIAATAPPEFKIGPSNLTPSGILWWVEEDIGDFGGANTVLKSAAIGPDCSVTPRGSPKSLNRYNDGTLFPGFSVDGATIYFGNLAVPLAEIGEGAVPGEPPAG